jgi:hypothetical protein
MLGDREVLRARSPAAGFGRVGLWASGRRGLVEFDDAAFGGDRRELSRRRRGFVAFGGRSAADPFMQTWSAATADWEPVEGGGVAYRFPCHSGACVRLALDGLKTPATILWSGEGGESGGAACGVRVDPAGRRVELVSGGKTVASGPLGAAGFLEVRLGGGELRAGAPGSKSLAVRAGEAVRTRLTVKPAALAAAGALGVRPARGLDLAFDHAPVELVATSGAWGLANRWMCDPRWSWFSGRARPLCAAWTARSFTGDQRLDLFAALMMTRRRVPHEIPRDFGVTICGDGLSPFSGYALVFGAEDNRCTRLYRRGRLVAETRDPAARFPCEFFSTPSRSALHQVWSQLSLGRRGNAVTFSLNGVPRLTWRDPAPLAGGRAAVWAMRGGMMAARLRVDAAEVGPLEPDLGGAGFLDPACPFSPAHGGVPPPKLTPFADGAWRVSSPAAGAGPAVAVRGPGVDPAAAGRLEFRFRAGPGTTVDLFLRSNRGRYRLGLTGPTPDPGGAGPDVEWLGRVPGLAADGQWRRVSVNLGAFWRDFWRGRRPDRPAPRGETCEVLLGPPDAGGYLAAGLGGNRPGAWYELTPPEWGAPAEKDLAPPRPGKMKLVGNTADRRAVLVVPLADAGGSGLDRHRLTMLLGGRPLKIGSPGVTYSEVRGELSIDLAAAGARPGPAGEYRLLLRGISDLARNRLRDQELTLDFDAVADRRPPESVSVALRVGGQDLALDLGPERFRLSDKTRRCVLRPVRPRRAGDPLGWTLTALEDGTLFNTYCTSGTRPFDLGLFPEMDLRCRFGPSDPLAVVFRAGGRPAVAAINEARTQPDGTAAWRPERAPAADRSWQDLSLPLLAILRKANSANLRRPLTRVLRFGDAGERRSRRGARVDAADVRLVPAVNPEQLALTWSAWDAGRATACRSAIDNRPDTVPEREELKSGKLLPPEAARSLREGNAWLHLRFADASGNWSPPRHYRLIVDRSAPEVKRRGPAGEKVPRADGFDLHLTDRTGVDPASIKVLINGREFLPGKSRGLTFDSAEGRLSWDARLAWGRRLAAGNRLEVQVTCADFAGNSAAPRKWSWEVDPAGDTEAPQTPSVRFSAAGGLEKRSQGRRAFAASRAAPARGLRLERAGADGRTLRFVREAGPGGMAVCMEPMPWRLDRYPVLNLEYRTSPGMDLELLLDVSGREVRLPLAGDAGASWRQVQLDLLKAARAQLGDMPLYCVWQVVFRGPPGRRNRPGSFFEIRRPELWTGSTPGTGFLLESGDAGSGLAGYSVVLDRKADTIPPERLGTPLESARSPGRWILGKLPAGEWWLHARAADLAGNWSGTTHLRLRVPEVK